MDDYKPVDLSKWCNKDVSVLGEGQQVNIGHQTLLGLPFLIGNDQGNVNGKCFISLDSSNSGISIPINQKARRVIVAHRLLESDLSANVPPGEPVADYGFRLSGGLQKQESIRNRFEIAVVPTDQRKTHVFPRPFRAVPDQYPTLMPRYEGAWDQAGRRQMETTPWMPRSYYLWVWENPEPNSTIENIQIIPKGLQFVLAGITLGLLEEHPFARQSKRPTKIVLADSSVLQKPFDLQVEVDRGKSTYTHSLPITSYEEFLSNSHKGWGEEQNTQSSPAYVEVSAIPSATVKIKAANEEIGKVNWGEVENKGIVKTPQMSVQIIDPGKNWVHVTVLDEDTGKPVPCRVHFRSPEGVPYQPHGYHNQVNSNLDTWHIDVGGDLRLGQITYASIDGTCQGWLPRGKVIVDVARGFEYEPLRTSLDIAPGQRELTLRIKRWINMNAQRWFSGDSHVHFLSPQGAHTESRSEDLNVVNLLQSQWGSLFTNTEDFTGKPDVSPDGNTIVYVSQENRQHFMGHMILWGLKKPVMPWCSDGPGEAELGGSMEIPLSEWADQCHSQGGFVISPHFPNPNGETAALIATGRLDGVEMIRQMKSNHDEYYRYLNCGYRLPLVGGTDKMSSDVPVGLYRTYVQIPEEEEFNYENWCSNVARGRTFLSGGPIIHFTVNGSEIGDTVNISGPGTVEVEAWAESTLPINQLEIVQDGHVVSSTESKNGTRRLALRERLKVNGHTWLAARCGGKGYFGNTHYDIWKRGIFAHTSPIYVACNGDWWMYNEKTAQYMLTLIEGDLAYIKDISGQAPPETTTHHHGEADHMAYLTRPFLEGRKAIHQRMHSLNISH